MFLASPENYKGLENKCSLNDFKGSLIGCLSFNEKEIEVFNNTCIIGKNFFKLLSTWVSHFYTVMKRPNVLDASERIMIENVLKLGFNVFNDKLNKLSTQ